MPNKETITIKHGPQFQGLLSTLSFFGAIGFTIVGILLFLDGDFRSFYFIPLVFLLIAVFFDYRGVSFDFKNQRLRAYTSYFFLRFGRWHSFDEFTTVRIEKVESTSQSISNMMTQKGSKTKHQNFYVYLEGESIIDPIQIGEYSSHAAARNTMKDIAIRLNLTVIDDSETKKAKPGNRKKKRKS